jgi:DNA-binding MarR family transcriptional regulator
MPASNTQAIVSQIARIRELANQFIEQELARQGIVGIVPAHGTILAFLFNQNHPVPIKDIVACTGRVKSTVTGILQTIEQHGYIERTVSPEDSRVSYISLTDKGRALREPFYEISRRLLETLYGNIPQSDRETLVRLLNQIQSNVESE